MSICYVEAINTAIETGSPILSFLKAKECEKEQITKMILYDVEIMSSPTKLVNDMGKLVEAESDGTFQGYVGVAFQNAFYHLVNTPKSLKFEKVMIDTISLGGDTDTNACIAGALYGACHGYTVIEKEFIVKVMDFISNEKRRHVYFPLDHQNVFNMLKINIE